MISILSSATEHLHIFDSQTYLTNFFFILKSHLSEVEWWTKYFLMSYQILFWLRSELYSSHHYLTSNSCWILELLPSVKFLLLYQYYVKKNSFWKIPHYHTRHTALILGIILLLGQQFYHLLEQKSSLSFSVRRHKCHVINLTEHLTNNSLLQVIYG